MGRNWHGRLLFALALAMLALAPGVTAIARSYAVQDGAAPQLCWNAAQSGPQQDGGSSGQDRLHFGCVFCQLSTVGLTPIVSVASSAEFATSNSYLLKFRRTSFAPSPWTVGKTTQARAPPQFS